MLSTSTFLIVTKLILSKNTNSPVLLKPSIFYCATFVFVCSYGKKVLSRRNAKSENSLRSDSSLFNTSFGLSIMARFQKCRNTGEQEAIILSFGTSVFVCSYSKKVLSRKIQNKKTLFRKKQGCLYYVDLFNRSHQPQSSSNLRLHLRPF